MEILILVVLMTHPFSGMYNVPVLRKVIGSSDAAAVELWRYREDTGPPEPVHYEGHLYKVDLGEGTVEEIRLPVVTFRKEK